jgi:hypothetical protein
MAGDCPGTFGNAVVTLAFFCEDVGAMRGLVDRALALNPSFARGWYLSGLLRWWAGQPDLAIEHVEVSLRLSPRARFGWGFYVIGGAHLLVGASTTRYRRSSSRYKTTLISLRNIAISPPATLIRDGSTRRERSSRGCAPSALSWYQASSNCDASSIASFTCRACALAAGEGTMSQTRRLAAILAADVAGYSRLMGADEEGTLERLKALRRELVDPKIAELDDTERLL